MKLSTILRSSTLIASVALLGLAGALAMPTSAAAERLIPMPSGLCTWNYADPSTDVLFSRLAARNDFGPSMSYVTANCATALCKADWTGEGAKATIALIQKGDYYGDLVRVLGKACPDATLPLTAGATASIDNPVYGPDHGGHDYQYVAPTNGTDEGTDEGEGHEGGHGGGHGQGQGGGHGQGQGGGHGQGQGGGHGQGQGGTEWFPRGEAD